MCERTYCRHEHEKLCSCPPVTCRDALGMAAHLAENMEKVQWSLTYNSLKDIKPYQLCLVGKCRICGGRLCMEQRRVEADSTGGFLCCGIPAFIPFSPLHRSGLASCGVSHKVCRDVP